MAKSAHRLEAEELCSSYPEQTTMALARRLRQSCGIGIEAARMMIRLVREQTKTGSELPLETHSETESCQRVEQSDDCALTYYGKEIKTVEQLLESQNIDMRIWEVVEQTINNYEVTGKKSNGQNEDGRKRPDTLWKTGNTQIKVKLRRKAPKVFQDAVISLVKNWTPYVAKNVPKLPKGERYLLIVSLSDLHFGKYCWAPESGNNYDLTIARKTAENGLEDLLTKAMRYAPRIDQIWFPFGNDFFHSNDWHSRTVNETRVESTDDRYPKVYECGIEFTMNAVDRCSEIAPVEADWIPGNHDFHSSWHLAMLMRYAMRNVKSVKVNINLRARTYKKYGVTVIGMCHGDKVKENKLPTLMSAEARHLLSEDVKFREWHLGHLHKTREAEFVTADSYPNTLIRRMPSLCGTDGWHDQQGFVDTYKMAESYLYSFNGGPEAKFITHAKT